MWDVLVIGEKLLLKTIRLAQKPLSHMSAETCGGLLSLTLIFFPSEIVLELFTVTSTKS